MASVLVLFHRSHLNPRMELFAEALTEANHDVSALCWRRGGSSNAAGSAVPTQPIPSPGFGASLLNALFLPLVYVRFLRAIAYRNPDLLFCAHVSLLPLAVVVGWLTRTPVVYDVVEPYREGYGERDTRLAPVFTSLVTTFERVCLRSVDGITVIDTDGDRLEERYSGFTRNLEVVYNVPRLKSCPKRDGAVETVVYAGTINDRKGVPMLLEAFAVVRETHPETTLLLVGDSVDDTLEQLHRRADELGVTDAVQFVGRVDYDEVHDHLARADVGVAPYQPVPMFELSRWNTRKIPDYMNAALPVVGPDFGGFAEILDQTECGLAVDTADIDALADALQTLIDDPERARRLGANGRDTLETRYNWETEKRKVVRVVQRALAGHPD